MSDHFDQERDWAITAHTIYTSASDWTIPILSHGLWPELAHRIASGQSQSQIAREMKISRTMIGNTLANPEFRKLIGEAYDRILKNLANVKPYFQAHAESACLAILQVMNDPNATASERLRSATLILKGAGVPGFQSGNNVVVQVNNTNDNRTLSFEEQVHQATPYHDALPREKAAELTGGVGLTADWAGETILERIESEPFVPASTPDCEQYAEKVNSLLESDGSYQPISIDEEAELEGVFIPEPGKELNNVQMDPESSGEDETEGH